MPRHVCALRALLSTALLLAWTLSGRAAVQPAAAQSSVPPCGRIAILLAGYNTSSGDVPGTFQQIVAQGMNRVPYASPPIDFSYSYPAPYTAAGTYNALPDNAVDALHRTIGAQIARCPTAQIDLIGHSLGGVVGLRYLALYGSTPEGAHVRHLITLDSPVNGTSYGRLIVFAALLGEQRLAGSATGLYLVAQHRDPTTKSVNVALARRLAPTTRITTIASRDDWIVPPGDAEIAGFSQEFSLGRNYAACAQGLDAAPSCLGHDRVLHSAKAMAAIRTALATQTSPSAPAPATPTPR